MENDEFVVLEALRILTILIACVYEIQSELINSTDTKPFPPTLIPILLASLSALINGPRLPPRDIAIQVLGAILGTKQFRVAVWEEEECISG